MERRTVADKEEWLAIAEKSYGGIYTTSSFLVFYKDGSLVEDREAVEHSYRELARKHGWHGLPDYGVEGCVASLQTFVYEGYADELNGRPLWKDGPPVIKTPLIKTPSKAAPPHTERMTVTGGLYLTVPADYPEQLHDEEKLLWYTDETYIWAWELA